MLRLDFDPEIFLTNITMKV